MTFTLTKLVIEDCEKV